MWTGFKTEITESVSEISGLRLIKITHITHVGLQFSHTLVLGCVQDDTEVGKVLLGINLI